ncbi:ECF transporter S component [Peptoniphilus stercorisuis]|uniref:Riboflavin transporter n=1 Tax=Peptoniphilus stercorisuis TaxID=1436965 RepID=A0ABS4KDZ4_9FIRM|nr:ECF transporter S component [Peptoniphilus stercorisuis]MBP2025978.1 riboflavin transporter FmnP [Peptoniphilus stercorisuis]
MNKVNSRNNSNVRVMTKVGMLGAIAFILMYFQFPLAFIAPSFMQVDIADLPVLIGSFALGPIPAILISAIKNILHLAIKGTSTGGVGELSNFIVSSVFAVTAGIIYKKKRTFKGAIVGLFIGTIVMTITALISNYFFIFPLYAKLMPMEAIINAGAAITSRITDLWSLMIYSVLPFNLLKGFITSVVTILIYKRVSPIFKN